MKIFVTGGTFDASAQTYTFPAALVPELERILFLENATDGIIIYAPADVNLNGSLVGQILTLSHDTTAMADGDDLMVYYDLPMAPGALVSLMTAELDALANGAGATDAAAFDNAAAYTLWSFGDFEIVATSTNPMTAGATIDLYLLVSVDGANYEQVGPNAFVGSLVCLAANSQRVVLRGVPLPQGEFKAHIINNSGQALLAVNTLKLLPFRGLGLA